LKKAQILVRFRKMECKFRDYSIAGKQLRKIDTDGLCGNTGSRFKRYKLHIIFSKKDG